MSDDPVGPPLEECPVCGAVGLPERIQDHDCAAFRSWRAGDKHGADNTPDSGEETVNAE